MDAVILAGGRGRRMGALSRRRQKGTLSFNGRSILAQIVDDLLAQKDVDTIWVATGYREGDVKHVLTQGYATLLAQGKISIVESPHIEGELPRFIHTIRHMKEYRDCLVRGVDTLLPPGLLPSLLRRVFELHNDSVLIAASARIHIAPTHHRVRLMGEMIESYDPVDRSPMHHGAGLYSDTGTRYFPVRLVREMACVRAPAGIDFIDGFLKSKIEHGERARALVFADPWRHFGSGRDFLK